MAGLLDRDLVVVTGKGGAGKSTVAAALGIAAARRGRRTIVAEVARRDDVRRALGGGAGAEVRLRERLHHTSIDPEEAMEEYLLDQLPSRAAAEVLVRSRAFTYLAAATPGLRELLTVGKVWDLAQDERRTGAGITYDLVVLDAPATGHGVAILEAPRTIAAAAMVGRIARQARTIDEMLSDPERTGVVGVARPEEMPVAEALALEAARPLDLLVCNAVRPRRLRGADLDALAPHAGWRPVEAALAAHGRARVEHAQLARLRRAARAPVTTLPWRAQELGLAELEDLSRELERAL